MATASAAPVVWPLRGTPAPNADAVRVRPIVVKVANDPPARPQSGLADADLILEIPVEGGLTRLSLVFQSRDPSKVGPVRSARQSDIAYLGTLHAILVHVGASEQVAKLVRDAAKSGAFVDVDEFEHADTFERTTDRPAPYNAYVRGSRVRSAAGSGGGTVDVPALAFGPLPGGGTGGSSLTIGYGEPVRYSYDAGAYHSDAAGIRTRDAATGDVGVDNVVVIRTDVTEIPGTADAAGSPSFDYRSTGSGPVIVLRDGQRFDGTWSRTDGGQYAFKDAAGGVIMLKPGLTWLHVVGMDVKV